MAMDMMNENTDGRVQLLCFSIMLLLCCCSVVATVRCSPVDDEDDEDGNSGDDYMSFPPRTHTIYSHVFVEYSRLCTHCTTGLPSAHSILIRGLAARFAFIWQVNSSYRVFEVGMF